jgi:lipoprotein-anchoring transpeptidase ErfK/SrfK
MPPEATSPPLRYAAAQPRLGGGFIEFLFGNGAPPPPPFFMAPGDPRSVRSDTDRRLYARAEPAESADPARPAMDPRYQRQLVDYSGREAPGTVVISTPDRFLYLVAGNGKALRYGIGVGRPGFTWAGVKQISMKREWPDWTPPDEMLRRRPDLPRHMAGGPENPLGARAMYLGSSLYRIHGSNEPWTIGTQVSSGCIRMRNEDVIDLYGRVKVGTRVIVI